MILPMTVLLIFIILYMMFQSVKWASLILVNVAMAPVGGSLALLLTHTNISVSSSVGFLALFGVSVQTGVIMLEYINQLRASGMTIEGAAIEGAVLRLRPIMMTMLVATLGLLPAAMSHWHRVGLAEALCHRHRWRTDGQPCLEHLHTANSLCVGCQRDRCAARTGSPFCKLALDAR
jgi:multidrug efflux pump subunit AcrB